LAESDLVLAIGTRFQAVATWFWSLPMPARLIHIDIDPCVIGRTYKPELSVVGDAREAAAWLAANVVGGACDAGYIAEAADVAKELHGDLERRIGPDHQGICDSIDKALPNDRNVVCDAMMVGTTWGSFGLPVRTFRGFAYSTSLAIGPALPLGIGAAIGSGRRTVVIHGDGGIMLNLGELATAVDTQAPVIVLVFNDRGYGTLKRLQSQSGVAHVGVDLHTPDFTALGAAMGMPSHCVATIGAFEGAFARALAVAGPSLIEIDLTKMVPAKL
jgi:acetolactate synthase-1/2/3 large subunit